MPSVRMNRVKLVDIAQASGVSLTAVSLALSDKPGISQETRVRVLETARSLGYRFRSPPDSAPGKAIKTVGLLVKAAAGDEPHANHVYAHIIAGVEVTCRQMGISLLFANLPVDSGNYPTEVPALLEKGDADAILLAGVMVNDTLDRLFESRACPVVLIDSYSPSRTYNAVLSDNVQGACQATEFLLSKGHRQVGFVGGSDQAYPSFLDRRQGYRNAMAGCSGGAVYFADCGTARGESGPAALALIRQHPQITALACMNDETAISAMYALIEQGYRVPQDISIIGFDDIYIAERVVPALTTMRVNKQGMGQLAVQLLLNQTFQGSLTGVVTSIFQPSLVERGSVQVVP